MNKLFPIVLALLFFGCSKDNNSSDISTINTKTQNLEEGYYIIELYRVNILDEYFNNTSIDSKEPLNIRLFLTSNGKDLYPIRSYDISGNKGDYILDEPLRWFVNHKQLNNYQVVAQEVYPNEDMFENVTANNTEKYDKILKKISKIGLKLGIFYYTELNLFEFSDFKFSDSNEKALPAYRYVYPENPESKWIFNGEIRYDNGQNFLYFRWSETEEPKKVNSEDRYKHQTDQEKIDSLNKHYGLD